MTTKTTDAQTADLSTDTVAIPSDVKTRSTFTAEVPKEPKAEEPKAAAASQSKIAPAAVSVEKAAGQTMREMVLDDASDKISVTRDAQYGDASESFARIAALWTAREVGLSDRVYTVSDVAQMLALLKMSRLAYTPKHGDSWIDLVGYAALGAEVSNASII